MKKKRMEEHNVPRQGLPKVHYTSLVFHFPLLFMLATKIVAIVLSSWSASRDIYQYVITGLIFPISFKPSAKNKNKNLLE